MRHQFSSASNPYDVLGIKSDATSAEIRAAYIKAVKANHPDLVQDEAQKLKSNEKIKEINLAYEAIQNGFYKSGKNTHPSSNHFDFDQFADDIWDLNTFCSPFDLMDKTRLHFTVERAWQNILTETMESPEGQEILKKRDQYIDKILSQRKWSLRMAWGGGASVVGSQVLNVLNAFYTIPWHNFLMNTALLAGGGVLVASVQIAGNSRTKEFRIMEFDNEIHDLMIKKFKEKHSQRKTDQPHMIAG